MLSDYSYLISSIIIFLLGFYVFLKDSRRGINRLFFLMSLSAVIYGIIRGTLPLFYPDFYTTVGSPTTLKGFSILVAEDISMTGFLLLPAFFIHLSLLIATGEVTIKKKLIYVLIYLPIVCLWSALIIIDFLMPQIVITIYQLPLYMMAFYYILTIAISFFLLIRRYVRLKVLQEKIKIGYFILGSFFPAILGSIVAFLMPIFFNINIYDWLTWPLFVIGYFFIAQGVLRAGLFSDYREILETIFKNLTELVLFVDNDGFIILTNGITLYKLKFKEEEIIGKKIGEILDGGDERFKEIKKKLTSERTISEDRVILLTSEGEKIPFLIISSLIRDGFIFIGRDIRDLFKYQIKLEEEVKEKTSELEEARIALEIKVRARTRELKKLAESLEIQVQDRTKELQGKVNELEEFHKSAVERELKMIELKREALRLKNKLEQSKMEKRSRDS